jgi:hypothetical protein
MYNYPTSLKVTYALEGEIELKHSFLEKVIDDWGNND